MLSEFLADLPGNEDFEIYTGKGCSQCSSTGYSGRVGLYELLVIDDTISRGISQGVDLIELQGIAEDRGFKPMFVDGLVKVKAGLTSFAEVMRVCRGAENGAV